jgi:CubicO group peptidase (beta-lactamase class C family)
MTLNRPQSNTPKNVSQAPKPDLSALPNDPRVDAIVNSYVHALAAYQKNKEEHSRFPGGAVMVRENDKIVHIGCYGYANLETKQKITPTTIFELGSMSKQFTALAILRLIHDGKLNEDDLICNFFPEFPRYADKMTVGDLIHHVGGLPDYSAIHVAARHLEEDWYETAMVTRDNWYPQMAPRIKKEITNKDVLQWIASQKLLPRDPDTKFEYSNSGYVVLAELVEVVSKMRYADFLKKYIFGELGMDRTFVFDEQFSVASDAPEVVNHARCYNPVAGLGFIPVGYTPLNFIYGDGNIHSNILDLATWELQLHQLDYATICATHNPNLKAANTLRERLWNPVQVKGGGLVKYGAGWNLLHSKDEYDVDKSSKRDIRKYESRAEYHRGKWLGWRAYIARSQRWEIPGAGKNIDPATFKSLGIVVISNHNRFKTCLKAQEISKLYWGELKQGNIMNRFDCR